MILVDPAAHEAGSEMLPVFRGILSAANEAPIAGRPQILPLNAQTQTALAWDLSPSRFSPKAIFTRPVFFPIMRVMQLLSWLGGLGILGGLLLLFFAVLEKLARFPFTASLANRGWLQPLTLLTSFWLGYTARAAIAWGYEREHGRQMGMNTPMIGTAGLAWAALLFVPHVSILIGAWSVVLCIAGWMIVAFGVRMGSQRAGVD